MTDAWFKKMQYTYTREYYSAMKKEWTLAIGDNMVGLESITPSEISQGKTNTI